MYTRPYIIAQSSVFMSSRMKHSFMKVNINIQTVAP